MRLTLFDARQLGVILALPGADKFYNWVTTGWETPFNAPAHLLPLVPMEPSPSAFATVLSIDVGDVLNQADASAIIATYTGSGTTLALGTPVDVIQGPPLELPARFAWQR